MITILDYGVGNVFNLKMTIERLGYECRISDKQEDILKSELLLLPGVGAFKEAMKQLKQKQLINPLNKRVAEKKPMIGICLGMQILFEGSEEAGFCEGLGYMKGIFKKIPSNLKVPHMGWNKLLSSRECAYTKGLVEEYFYYVHSYYLTEYLEKDLVGYAEYDVVIPGIVQKDQIVGLQFHPEKSGDKGLELLKNIIESLLGEAK